MDNQELKKEIKDILQSKWREWKEDVVLFWEHEKEFDFTQGDIDLMKEQLESWGYTTVPLFDEDSFDWEELDEWVAEELQKEDYEVDAFDVRYARWELESDGFELTASRFYGEVAKELNRRMVKYLKKLFPDCQVEIWKTKKLVFLEREV